MKKFYSTLALACAVGVSALAATPEAPAPAKMTFDGIQTVNISGTISAPAKSMTKAPAKVAAAIEDIEGLYDVDYESMFTSGKKDKTTAEIIAVSDDQILIQMEPYCTGYSNVDMDPLVASYDASTGTITIVVADNLNLGTYVDSEGPTYNLELNAYNRVPNPNDPGKYMAQELDEIIGVVQADGTIKIGEDNTCFGFQLVELPGSYIGGFMGATFVAPDFFKFKADEWESVGDALFTEDWMNLWLYEDDPDYVLQPRNIPMMRNKANNKMYLLENPFKVNNWVNEDPSANGYLVFVIEDNSLVPMRPLTPSGLWLTLQKGGFPEQLYVYNQDGLYIYSRGFTVQELKALYAENEIQGSDYNPATKTVTLRNLLFGYTSAPVGTYAYTDIKEGVYMIKSDAFSTEDPGSVSNILNDSENGVKRFYNLQGVEIANPAAGELVIVKEGNKTSKTIIR